MPSEQRFAVVRQILERKGWYLDRVSGSHHIFKKFGVPFHINIPVHNGKVKPKYVKDANNAP